MFTEPELIAIGDAIDASIFKYEKVLGVTNRGMDYSDKELEDMKAKLEDLTAARPKVLKLLKCSTKNNG
jgi:hypothetical protein